jgi:hypothetical protein
LLLPSKSAVNRADRIGIGAKRMACFLRTTFRANILGASHPARKLASSQARSTGVNRLSFRAVTLDIATFTIAPLA